MNAVKTRVANQSVAGKTTAEGEEYFQGAGRARRKREQFARSLFILVPKAAV